jgi:hypothetical protein
VSKASALKRRSCAFCVMAVMAAVSVALLVASPGNRGTALTVSQPKVAASSSARAQANLAALPIAFERNDGQADPETKYLTRGQGYRLSLTSSQAVLTLHRRAERS